MVATQTLHSLLGEGEIVTFVVRDLDRSRAFWVDRLRLPIVEERPGEFVMVRAGSTRLCIDRASPDQPARDGGATLILFARDLDAAEQCLARSGADYERGKDPEHGAFLLLRDPDGYQISISEISS